MARAETVTLLSLSEFGAIMGIDPWHLNQIQHAAANGCMDVFYQFPWQKDWLSRESLAQAIARAESELAHHLGFWPAPVYFVDERVEYPRPRRATSYGYGGTIRGQPKAVVTRWKKIIGPGIMARVPIAGNQAVTYVDSTGSGMDDQFTLTVAATDSNGNPAESADEIAIYFNATDRIGAVHEKWRIRPIDVALSGGNATITGHKADLAKPKMQNDPTIPDSPLTDVAATYATQVDVYRVYRDNTASDDYMYQGYAVWEAVNCPPDCTVEVEQVCVGVRNPKVGQVSVEVPDGFPQNREPDRVYINYLAGVPLVDGKMEPEMARVVAALACHFLPTEKCGCEWVDRIIDYWRAIPSQDSTQRGARQIPVAEIMGNPWGVSRGARQAWEYVMQHSNRLAPAVVY